MVDFCVFGRHENVEELLGLAHKRQKLETVETSHGYLQFYASNSWLVGIHQIK